MGLVWNKLLCKMYGHPEQSYKITHVQTTSFFSGGIQTIGVVQCRRCKSELGRV